jgi:hypothetical protein
MIWSLVQLLRRRIRPVHPTTAKQKARARRRPLYLELLEDRTVPSTYSISSSFNSTAVAPGDTIWFSSVISGVGGMGTAPATINVTNQTITFSDSVGGSFNVSLPNAVLTLTPGGTTATTNYTGGQWASNDPSSLGGNLFLSGYELPVPVGLHGSDNPVTWTATFSDDTSGLSFKWEWAAAAYTSFNSSYGSLGIKPCDSNTASIYANSDHAGTPESYKTHVIGGATGTGGSNYTGNYSPNTSVTPTFSPTYVSLAGTVYNDANNNGIFDTGDTGISGVTLTLTGTTSGGTTVASATTTTASDGTYSFTTDGSGSRLVAGTYQIAETEPAGYYAGSDNVGTVGGTADGSVISPGTIGSISLGTGQNGINYNFGEVDPFTPASVPYPYSSSNPLTNIAFNESGVLADATVNVANGTLNMWYSDEHALTLGVSSVTVIASNGTSTTTNYAIAPEATNSSAINPAMGDPATTGDQAAVDSAGRLLMPSLFITDITANASSTSGDWQNGGTALAPNAVYGSWKSFAITVNHQNGTVTETGEADPVGNSWTQLGTGADTAPVGLTNQGYCTEVQWSLTNLYSSGVLIPGHNYRFYFIVHDGDQNNTGGDCGQAAYDFMFRGPVTIAGNVYNDVLGNGVDSAGDNGIGGVTLTLTGTTATGQSVSVTTTTASNGTYTFTKDSSGKLLSGGTYQVAETQPAGYLPGSDTVGMTNWSPGFAAALAGTDTSGAGHTPGYVHGVVNSATDNMFSGTTSLDTNGISNWKWATGQPNATDNIADAFGVNFADSLTGHNFLLAGMDRYDATAGTTVGFWAFQNSISVTAGGTFSGVHTNGDLLVVVNVTVNGPSSANVYEWTGTDASGTLTAISPPVGAMDLFVNINPVSVPWTFVDKTGHTSPQAGEFVEFGVDLNGVYGLTVPHFASFMMETRSSNAAAATLLDFESGNLNSVSGSFTADGTLVPTNTIGSIVIGDGENGINYNFGNVQPITVSGVVYHDINGNGVLDSGEPGIAGVTLTLTGINNLGNSVTATTTTATNGAYSFSTDSSGKLIAPGTYQIVESPPSGYLAGATSVGTVNGKTVGTVVSSGTIGSITETTGQNGINYDFGEVKAVTVGGLVYQDTNGNGALDSGEPGISGVTLTLSGSNNLGQAITATTTTATNGTYSFAIDSGGNPLRPGTYQITETLPSGYVVSATTVGTVGGVSDGSVVSAGTIGSVALTSGQSGINYNFGNLQPVTVSGLVYQDNSGSGVYSSSDLGIAGVTLTLSGTNGLGQSITATTTTASDGTYSFSTDSSGKVLWPGTYQVVETQPTGYFLGAATVGTVNGTVDGTVSSATKIISIVVTSGQAGINYLFGDVKGVTISGTVYQDMNGSGTYSSSDPGVAGATVTLTGTNNIGQSITVTTTTASNGTYTFNADSSGNALRPGTYQVTETIPSSYLPGTNFVGTLIGTPDNFAQGFAEALSGSGPGYMHNTANNVFKTGASDTGGMSTWNSTSGAVPQKDLVLDGFGSIYTDPSGHQLLLASADRYANNGDSTIGFWFLQSSLSLNSSGSFNGTHTTGDILLVDDFSGSSGTLGVYEWIGNDTSGSLVPLTVPAAFSYFFVNTSPFSVPWSFTDSGGFTSPQAGEYMAMGVDINAVLGSSVPHYTSALVESRASNSPGAELKSFLFGGFNAVTGSNVPDGILVGNNAIGSIVTTSGVSGINYNFGLVKPDSIAGTVYQDTNGNGVFDSGEPGIAGVTVTLTGTNNLGQATSATTTTAANGTYSFSADSSGNALRPGTYQVTETPPSGYLPGTTSVGTVGGTADGTVVTTGQIGSIVLNSGQNGINYNFGEVKQVSISGLVYQDTNGNGALDSGEPGIAGVTMTLSGTNGLGQLINATTTTAGNGTYSFTTDSSGNALRPGTYQVVETPPSGYLLGAAAVGTVSGTADGTVSSPTKIISIALTSGQNGINYNFGDVQPVTVSGLVYQDINGIDAYSSSDPGIAGVTVTLTGFNNLGQVITATTTTAGNGTYSFSTDSTGNALRPGTYQVAETQPSGYLLGLPTVGTVNGTTDGLLASATTISSIALTSGQNGINYLFGDVKAVAVSGLVYQDINGVGTYSSSDPGIGGVTLTLSGTNGLGQSITATTTTASNGTYSFTTDSTGNALRPGMYQIVETLPSGFMLDSATVGTVSGSPDGTVSSASNISSIVLTSGQAGINYLFANVKPVSISGLVYQDTNGTGVYSASDPGIAGVTLTLDAVGLAGSLAVATTTTASNGTYSFTTNSSGAGLWPGNYQVVETQPSGYLAGTTSVGTVSGTADGTVVASGTIGSIVLTSGQNGINYNFGDVKQVSISGTVYVDTNGTGVYSSSDPGLSGVTLTLSGTNGLGQSITATTTTASNGTYSFSTDSTGNALRPGTYQVVETAPSGYLLGSAAVGTVGGTADGTVSSPTKIVSIGLTSGQNGINYYFGDVQAVTISGTVYVDTNGTGVYSSSDPGISGVTLTLSGTNGLGQPITATTTTASNGTYSFSTDSTGNALRPGTYQVVETAPSGYLLGSAAVGTVSGTADGTVSSPTKIISIGLTSGQNGINYYFGDVKAVTVSGTVYVDTNGTGVYSSSDPGISGVTLTLSGTNGLGLSITATTTTASNGTYTFSTDSSGNPLRPGTYQVVETAPSGYLLGSAAVGTVGGTADGTVSSPTKIVSIGLTSGQNGINYYFGDVKAVTVSGTVYVDTNGTGVYSSSDPGISGVTLTLSGTNGLGLSITATTTTASNGTYSFSTDSSGNALRPGTYQVVETAPSGYLLGSAAVGTVGGTADGIVSSPTKIVSIGLTSGQNGINYYFGDVKQVSISGLVYHDINGNNVLDSGEPGISGVTLTLSGTNNLGQPITATATTAYGAYSFTTDSSGNPLRPGTYQVVETPPSGYLLGAAAVGTVGGTADGTVSSATKIISIALTSGQAGINYDFGLVKQVGISGLVYQDINGTDVYSSSDPGIAGVTLTLSGTNGLGQSISATTTTASNGAYSFSSDSSGNPLRPGTYQVVETQPSGYLLGAATVGTVGGTADGTASSATKITSIALTSGQNGINYLFGDVQPVTISGFVYEDTNDNGVLDSGEPGIAGVTLTLSGTNNLGQSISATATTAPGGAFTFSTDSSGNSLRPGTYQVVETQPSSYVPGATTVGTVSGTADGTVAATGQISSIALTSGQNGINYDFGELKPVTISGLVYQDTNGTGVYSSSDPGISGVTVALSGTNDLGQSITASTTTASDGTFSFSTDSNGNLLRPGTYQITETHPSGYLVGATAVGTVSGAADGTVVTSGQIGSIVLADGQAGINYYFGEVKPIGVSGTVYVDSNDNGVLDSGEPGIAGVTITLSGTNNLGQSISATTTTASDGTYNFILDSHGNLLRPGTYQVTETAPGGYLAGATNVGTVNGTVDGSVVTSGQIGSIALTSGQSGVNYNFGEVQPVTIAGTVYLDNNGNGVMDAGDTPFANVTLTLSGTNGMGQSITATTTTAANGTYSFSTDSNGNLLMPGTYQITETKPAGYVEDAANVGTVNGTLDGTEASPGKISSIAMASGQNGINYNFGLNLPATVAGTVYIDNNRDGVFDSGDGGLSNITVTLTGTDFFGNSVSLTTTTDVNGNYSFTGLSKGTYSITVTAPGGNYTPEVVNVGTVNGATDGTPNANVVEIDQVQLTWGNAGINYNFGFSPPLE